MSNLNDGDRARVVRKYDDGTEVTITGQVWTNHYHEKRIGIYRVEPEPSRRSLNVSVEILERAKQPFYTNSDREPRIGDVAKGGIHKNLRWIYVGGGEFAAERPYESPGPVFYKPSAGRLTLVDPSELEES